MLRLLYSRLVASERYASVTIFCIAGGLYTGLFFLTLALCAAHNRDPISSLVIMEKDPTGYAILAENLLKYKAFTGEPAPPFVPSVRVSVHRERRDHSIVNTKITPS